ncbi:MAG: hypothetical protein JWQ81_1676 [Amycolatopsis sp.]|jgi:hypothetical protein|uniref:hypothetical protein n=1 Tax=Amycolatopsis sp. TaxID=37632 RepID=UPI00260E801B|nr:hypothetical protein [Amycolatopsis sp.]MCU1680937.1 hypothetical protein [Amycolatopsis sp.]
MALYNTPWGVRELPDDEAAGLRGQVGGGVTECTADEIAAWHTALGSEPDVTAVEGSNPKPGDAVPTVVPTTKPGDLAAVTSKTAGSN